MNPQTTTPTTPATTRVDLRAAMMDAIAAYMLDPKTVPADVLDAIHVAIEGVADGDGISDEHMDLYKNDALPHIETALDTLNAADDAQAVQS